MSSPKNYAWIRGIGSCLPEQIVTNELLARRLGIDAEQIFKSSGIRERRWASAGTKTSDLGAAALRLAIADARIAICEVDYLLFGTMTPDRLVPGSAATVQHAVGLREIPCLDIRGACCNALYGLQLAKSLVVAGVARNVAVCLAEVQSPYLDLERRAATNSMLFGDGAAAFIVSSERSQGAMEIVDVHLAANGSYVDDLGVRCPGTEFGNHLTHATDSFPEDYFPRMVGQSVILQASRRMVSACQTVLARNDLPAGDVRWLVPHQANANLLLQVSKGLGLTTETEVISVIAETGNTSSASMGIALDALRRSGRVKTGDNLLMPAFAAGFTWGAALCRG